MTTKVAFNQVSGQESGVVYVNPNTGDDVSGDGTSSNPFMTIQKAYDSLPFFCKSQQTIQLADGIYNTNYLSASRSVEMPRPAILFARGKFLSNRTQKNGSDMEASVVIKGNATTPSNVVIECNDTWSYGIYNSQGQIAIQDLHIKTNSGATSVDNLLTSHRSGAYTHCLNVSLDGHDETVTSIGMLTEGGGNIEFTTTTSNVRVENCNILCQAASKGDNLTVSGNFTLDDCDTCVNVANGARVDLTASGQTGQTITNCASFAINAQSNSYVRVNGADDGNHIVISDPVRLYHGAVLELIFTDIDDTTEIVNGARAYFNNSDYQGQILVDAGDVWFNGSDSFISPNSANDSPKPVLCRSGGRIHQSGTNNFNGSGGDTAHVANVVEQTISANGTALLVDWQTDTIRLSAASDYTGCTIPANGFEGQCLRVINYGTASVELVEDGTAQIATNSVLLSGSASANEYIGIMFVFVNGSWREFSRSAEGV